MTLVKTENRQQGVRDSIRALAINPVKGKNVLIKPNFNTADPVPGSTHNDTLAALAEELWKMGAKSISLGERSYPLTHEVMEQKGILPILEELDVRVVNFDELKERDWVEFRPAKSHWVNGFRIARPILETDCLISTCCLKTHQFGGGFYHVFETPCGCSPYIPPWL